MLEPTDLRIGNHIDYERTTHIVESLDKEGLVHRWHKMPFDELSNCYDTNYKNIEPIPLTKELLIKCGFTKSGSFRYYIRDIDNLFLQIFFELYFVDNIISYNNQPISYLHDLQNLYYVLYKKELQINL